MQRASGAIGGLILAIAVYFVLFWGYDALRILTSPTYGLEDVWRSQIVFGIGRFAGFGPESLLKLSAVLGALELTVAGVCAVHIADRLRSLKSGEPTNEILETGLLIAVAINIVAVAPAIWSQNSDLVRHLLLQLLLAAFAAVLCIIERHGRKTKETVKVQTIPVDAAIAEATPATTTGLPFKPWRR
jgi:hypothetical protein